MCAPQVHALQVLSGATYYAAAPAFETCCCQPGPVDVMTCHVCCLREIACITMQYVCRFVLMLAGVNCSAMHQYSLPWYSIGFLLRTGCSGPIYGPRPSAALDIKRALFHRYFEPDVGAACACKSCSSSTLGKVSNRCLCLCDRCLSDGRTLHL